MNLVDRLKQLLGLAEAAPESEEEEAAPAPARAGGDGAAKEEPRPATTLDLDASELLPITHDELRSSLQELIRQGGFRFTGRGFIPLGDERTKLINRALLTNGLLTPEQLADITRVAEEMERLQKGLAAIEQAAARSGEAAVAADREARARLKEQKKAEAADRRRLRQEAVAHRRATDIYFLGRGVSAQLNRRDSDADKLRDRGLPVLSTPADVAAAMGIPVPQLRWLAFHAEVATRIHYVHFQVPKRSGGTRTLSAPHRKLAAAQHWVRKEVLDKLPVETPAHGFVAGRSILTNARPHVGKAVLVNMDLEGFFPSIGWVRVRSVFGRLGYSPAVATILALLCTECPREPVVYAGTVYYVAVGPRGLPQGACTSPGLSNQVARRLDKRLGGLARKMGLTYTRYADDLTFSGDEGLNERVGYLMARVRHLAQEEGFAVNEKKSRVLRRHTAQRVTGLVVNDKPSLPRHELRRLRALLHRAAREGLDAQNRAGRPDFRAWLQGKIAYVNMVRPELGAKLQAQLQAVLDRT
jgi:retron-type reverse transcriptase